MRQYNGHHKGFELVVPVSSFYSNHWSLQLPFAVLYMMAPGDEGCTLKTHDTTQIRNYFPPSVVLVAYVGSLPRSKLCHVVDTRCTDPLHWTH